MFRSLTANSTIWKKRKKTNSEPIDFQSMGKIGGRIPQIVEFALTFSISKVRYFVRFDIIFEFLIYLLLENPTS